jgi:hypothetical protein
MNFYSPPKFASHSLDILPVLDYTLSMNEISLIKKRRR